MAIRVAEAITIYVTIFLYFDNQNPFDAMLTVFCVDSDGEYQYTPTCMLTLPVY